MYKENIKLRYNSAKLEMYFNVGLFMKWFNNICTRDPLIENYTKKKITERWINLSIGWNRWTQQTMTSYYIEYLVFHKEIRNKHMQTNQENFQHTKYIEKPEILNPGLG